MNYDALLLCLYILYGSEGSIFSNAHEPSEKNLLFHEDDVGRKVATTVKYRGKMPIFIVVGEGTPCKSVDV